MDGHAREKFADTSLVLPKTRAKRVSERNTHQELTTVQNSIRLIYIERVQNSPFSTPDKTIND